MTINFNQLIKNNNIEEIKLNIQKIKSEKDFLWKSDQSVIDGCRVAITLKNKKIVKLFLKEGLDPNRHVHIEGPVQNLLHFAVLTDEISIVRLLVDHQAEVNNAALNAAVIANNESIVAYLLEHRHFKCYSHEKTEVDFFTICSLLGQAALNNQESICDLLIKAGGEIPQALWVIHKKKNHSMT